MICRKILAVYPAEHRILAILSYFVLEVKGFSLEEIEVMEYGYPVLMFAFALGIILFALMMPHSLGALIHYRAMSWKRDPKYIAAMKKMLCLVAMAPVASGLSVLILFWSGNDPERLFFIPLFILIGGVAIAIWAGCKLWFKKEV